MADREDLIATNDTFMTALQERREYEFKLCRLDAQLYAQDRPEVNNDPWPDASNVRFQLSSLMLDDWLPDLAFLPYSSEVMAAFDTLSREIYDLRGKAETYFTQHMKLPKVNFFEQYLYFLARYAHYGEGYLKPTFNDRLQLLEFEHKHPLMIITPSNAKSLRKSEQYVEVVQLTENEFYAQYGDSAKMKEFVQQLRMTNYNKEARLKENRDHDQTDRDELHYDRIGISRSGMVGDLTLWIHNKRTNTEKFWRTLSPDLPDFDFDDKTPYPEGYEEEWMVLDASWEYLEERRGAGRGVTEKCQEAEYSATKAWQATENFRALSGNPVFSPLANSEFPSTTQNFRAQPGSIAPQPMQIMQYPPPPFSWTEARLEFQEYGERMAGRTTTGTGRALNRDKNETATETRRKAFESDKGSNFQGQLLSNFLQRVYTVSWGLIVANKPQSLAYVGADGLEDLPPAALSKDFILRPKGSMDLVNKEFRVQRKQMMLDAALKLPIMTPNALLNLWRSYVHDLDPCAGDEFVPDLASAGQDEEQAAMLDVFTLMMGGDVQAKPEQNHRVRAEAAMKVLATAEESGWNLTQPAMQGITNYIAQHKQMMQKTDPAGFQQFMQTMNFIDLMSTRKKAAEQIHAGNEELAAQVAQPELAGAGV